MIKKNIIVSLITNNETSTFAYHQETTCQRRELYQTKGDQRRFNTLLLMQKHTATNSTEIGPRVVCRDAGS